MLVNTNFRFRYIVFLLLLFVALISCQSLPQQFDTSVKKGNTDALSYANAQLPNGLRVLVISDPDAQKAAASLNIDVGSKDDPIEASGMAHFLEHMLFLGTEPFPIAGDYQAFMSQHGGSHNAYTAFSDTNYFFDIEKDHLVEALDRFSAFFISPTLEAEYIDREKNAVHSEFNAYINNEYRRFIDGIGQISNPDHPFGRFNVGNLDTLKGDDLADRVRQFWLDYYSADRMGLVIYGPQSIDELMAMATQKFSAIVKRETPAELVTEPIFKAGSLPAQFNYKPAKEVQRLTLLFPTPNLRPAILVKPVAVLGDIIGHEGEYSLFQYLKRKGWAESLSAGTQMSYAGGSLFGVDVGLTEAGETHIDDIVEAVFYAISLVKEEDDLNAHYKEMSALSALRFEYRQATDAIHTVRSIASQMREFPMGQELRGPFAMDGYSAQLTNSVLAKLTPQNMLLALTSPNVETQKVSPIYGTEYGVKALDEGLLEKLENIKPISAIRLPEANRFIPRQLNLHSATKITSQHKSFQNGLDYWCSVNTSFNLPHASLRLALDGELTSKSARQTVLNKIYARLLNDQANVKLYAARQAGFSASIYSTQNGLSLAIDGYSDKQDLLFKELLQTLLDFEVDPLQFAIVKDSMARGWRNADLGSPYQVLNRNLNHYLKKPSWSPSEYLSAIDDIRAKDVTRYAGQFTQAVAGQVQVYGNVNCAAVERQLIEHMTASGLQLNQTLRVSDAVILPKSTDFVSSIDLPHDDLSVVKYIQGHSDDVRERVLFGLTAHIMRPRLFHEIRTQQQHGYIVYSAPRLIQRWPGMVVVAQTPADSLQALDQAIEEFLLDEQKAYQSMTEQEFEGHVKALVGLIDEPAKNVWQAADRDWEQIRAGLFSLNLNQKLVSALLDLDLAMWRTFYANRIVGDSASRLMLRTKKGGLLKQRKQLGSPDELQEISTFKRYEWNDAFNY